MKYSRTVLHFFRCALINRYVFAVGFIFAYTHVLDAAGGMPPMQTDVRFEIPLLLYLYWYLNRITRPSRLQPWIAALPLIMAYGVFDTNFMQLGRLLRIIEIKELPELLAVLPIWLTLFLLILFGGVFFVFIRQIKVRADAPTVFGAVPFLILVLTMEFSPDLFITVFEKAQRPITVWSDIQSAEHNGRLWMVLYFEAKRNSNIHKMASFQDDPVFLARVETVRTLLGGIEKKRNVHLVALESFVDPDLFKGITFSKRPVHPEFDKLFKGKGSLSLAPVFGGGTAQSEFELLTGVPALARLSSMEFDVFTGNETYGLPALLSRAGYHTMATNAYKPDFFNSISAYKGLGFKASYYPREYAKGRDTYLSTGDVKGEKYMFDGVLLKQNLEHVTEYIKAHPEVPVFNYVISIFGHSPYNLNAEKRPMVIDVKSRVNDEYIRNVFNQYYYRTGALAEFVNGIRAADPQSLIIFISDHLPWLHGPETYEKLRYAGGQERFTHMNRVFFFENGRAVKHGLIHHYDIPDMILNYISQGRHCDLNPCRFQSLPAKVPDRMLEEAYMTIMAHAMR